MTDILTTMETVEKYTPSFSTAFKIGRNAGAARNESYKGLFGIQRAGLGRNSMAWQTNRAGYQNKMDSVKAARKTMSAPKKLVSMGAQYPARTIGGTAAVGGTGYGIDRKVRKNDNVSAFGVEISKKKEVSKAVNPFKAKKQVAAQMELLDSIGNKYLKKTPNFNPQGVLHGSSRLSGPKKAGDSFKQVQLNIAGAQARRKVNGQ